MSHSVTWRLLSRTLFLSARLFIDFSELRKLPRIEWKANYIQFIGKEVVVAYSLILVNILFFISFHGSGCLICSRSEIRNNWETTNPLHSCWDALDGLGTSWGLYPHNEDTCPYPERDLNAINSLLAVWATTAFMIRKAALHMFLVTVTSHDVCVEKDDDFLNFGLCH